MSKYSPKITNEICGYIKEGLYQKDAAMLSGISESTFYEWLSTKSEFSESISRASIEYKRSLLKSITRQTVKDGKLALEMLGRRYPNQFGKNRVEPPEPKEHEFTTTRSAFEALLAVAKRAEKSKWKKN